MCSTQESINFTRKFSCQKAAQDGRAYNKRETIAWKPLLRCYNWETLVSQSFHENYALPIQIDKI